MWRWLRTKGRAGQRGAKGYLRVHLRAKMLRAASVKI